MRLITRENKKTKRIVLFAAGLLLLAAFVRIADLNLRYNLSIFDYYRYNNPLTVKEENLLQEKPLLVGIFDEAPLAFLNQFNNYNAGIVVDYMSQLAIELGNGLLLKVVPEEKIAAALANGDIDIAVIEKTQQNAFRFAVSQPLCVVKGRILVSSNLEIRGIEDLTGMSLVTLRGDNRDGRIQAFLRDKGKINLIEVDNIYQCFALINKDLAAGYVGDDMEAAYFINVTKREAKFTFLDPVVYEKEICLATRRQDAWLGDILNKGILELKKKNLISQTQSKWLGDYDSSAVDLRQVEFVYRILLGIALLVLLFFSWNYVITQRVNTRTRELLENKEELRLIIDTMQSGIVVIENENVIVECNEAMGKLLGVSPQRLLGENCGNFQRLKSLLQGANQKQIFNYQNAYYYITSQSFANNKKLIVIEDYTEKYVHEKTTRQEAKMIAVGQLSAGLAHEIRNPLGLIKSYSYIIEKYCCDEIGRHAITVINDSVSRINKLIENLLRFSKLSNDESMLVDLEKLIQVIIELETKNIQSNDITLTGKVTGNAVRPVLLNEDMLKVVLLNLINNSIDSFAGITRQKKVVELTITVEQASLGIRIRDNGCGIPPEKLENVFDPFYSTKESGTGLGLYIISSEISKYDGKISVESTVGQGAEFNIILPIKE